MKQSEALQIISEKISVCTKCKELSEYRTENNYLTVPGTGLPNAKIMCIGEGPGQNEAEQGLPFVGKAGNMLTNILSASGLSRDSVFIANIVKCRPPNNREPTPEEAGNCLPFLKMQIKTVNPEWILCFGKTASVYLLGLDSKTSIGSLRGKVHEYEGRKLIATYHPSYLLRNPSAKKHVWDDLQPLVFCLQNSKPVV